MILESSNDYEPLTSVFCVMEKRVPIRLRQCPRDKARYRGTSSHTDTHALHSQLAQLQRLLSTDDQEQNSS